MPHFWVLWARGVFEHFARRWCTFSAFCVPPPIFKNFFKAFGVVRDIHKFPPPKGGSFIEGRSRLRFCSALSHDYHHPHFHHHYHPRHDTDDDADADGDDDKDDDDDDDDYDG